MSRDSAHTPVLLSESIEALQPRSAGRYVDATLGRGGHAEKMLELSAPDGMLLGIDADPTAIETASERLHPFGDRVVLVQSYFDDLESIVERTGFGAVQGAMFDLGVSSPQLDTAERGFSFQQDAPLDMRFGPAAEQTAADLVRTSSADELERIFREFGEERYARRVARRLVDERRRGPIDTTSRLAALVASAKPHARGESIHPATRVFQALRIAVNDELGRLRRALPQALDVLSDGGRIAVISFHSLEDRIVKHFFRQEERGCICPPQVPVCVCGRTPRLRVLTSHPTVASEAEVAANPRARSAKLRVAERVV